MTNLVMCVTHLENRTKIWTKHDQEVYIKAMTRCGEIYPEAPCMKLFIKMRENGWIVVCGEI